MNNTRLRFGRTWLVMLLMVVGSMTGYAQSNCFKYEDYDKTIINGLTSTGLAATSLTIPATVTTVRSGSFSSTSAHVLSALVIEAGGNPAFETGIFGEQENPLSDIQILGSSMTVANITALFTSLGSQGALSTVYIEDYSGTWSNIEETSVLTAEVSVTLPAALVSDQQFGDAKVYGRFEITKELITFCGNATFLDTDNGSNMLFYVAEQYCTDEDNSHYIYIKRVNYVAKGKGVLIHNGTNTSFYADLPRVSDESITEVDKTHYDNNMLVGVTEPTKIDATDGDKTNYIVVNELVNNVWRATFYPTSGGYIGANKAYLRVPTSQVASANERLNIHYPEETGISLVSSPTLHEGKWYDLQGRKLDGKPTTKGLYINNGKKHLIK